MTKRSILSSEHRALLKLLVKDWRYIRFPTLNFMPLGVPELPAFVCQSDTHLDDDFLRRVQLCFQRSSQMEVFGENASIWKTLQGKNTAFIEALLSDDPGALRPHASNLYAGATMYGMAHTQEFIVGNTTIYPKKYFSMRVRDSLLSLGTALGAINIVSNQQTPLNRYVEHLNQDLALLIKEIESKLGFELTTPRVGSPPVVKIGENVYNPDTIRHAYIPHRLKQIVDLETASILEIGGGYGCVARFGVLAGCKDWTIIDLPYVNAIQMLWLGSTLGPDMVSGHGEAPAPIKLVPSKQKDAIKAQTFTLALNMDSLPEIPFDEAQAS